jgi:hypothetical protein
MRILLTLSLFVVAIQLQAQIPKSGTYTYNWCDEEYDRCMSKCKIKFKGNKVWIYAPPNLSGTKEGELVWQGIILKHTSGKWFLKQSKIKFNSKVIGGCEGPPWFDFKRKRFWTC